MSNLLDLVKDQIGSAVMGKIANVIGINDREANSAVDAFIPALLSGVMNNTKTEEDAGGLLDLISSNNLGDGILDNLGDLLGGGDKTSSFLSLGSSLLSGIFGRNESGFINSILSLTGLGKGNSSKLLSILAPIALSVIGRMVKSKGLNAGSLLSLFRNEKSAVRAALPAGFAAFGESAKSEPVAVASNNDDNSGGGMGWLKWLLPLLLLALLLWWFMRPKDSGDTKVSDSTKVEKVEKGKKGKKGAKALKAEDNHDGHDHTGHNHAKEEGTKTSISYRIDKDGNIVDPYGFIVFGKGDVKKDKDGNIVDANGTILIPALKIKSLTIKTSGKKSPKLSVDKDGNLVDENGKVLFKKGEFKTEGGYYVDNEGNRIGFFKKIGKAIEGAAEKTAEAFKGVFTGLFAAKDKVGTSYRVSRMDFNKDNHRLTYYSKPEFEGLVSALDEYPNKKLEVRVYTNDGKNEKENMKLSENRANVVRDMLATLLGTKKGNVSFKGMGSTDAGKASKDIVEIYVAQ